jgi:hypothetical protein
LESLAATAATATASSSSSPPPSSNAQMIGDWALVATDILPPGKRKDGCNKTKMTVTVKEEMTMLTIIGRHLPHTTIHL